MKTRRLSSLIALGTLVALYGCSTNTSSPTESYDGSEGELGENLTDCTNGAGWVSSTGILTLTLASATSKVLMLTPMGGKLKVNGWVCNVSSGGAPIATSAIKKISLTGSASADTFVLDFANEAFAAATLASTGGVTIDGVSNAGDKLIVRGTSGNDTYNVGEDSSHNVYMALATGTLSHVKISNVPNLVVSMGAGNDTFKAMGGAFSAVGLSGPAAPDPLYTTTAGSVTTHVTVYGGEGNDTLQGGLGDDILYGGGGNDTFLTYSSADGADTYSGDGGTDTMDYSSRTTAVRVDLGSTNGSITGYAVIPSGGVTSGTLTISTDAGTPQTLDLSSGCTGACDTRAKVQAGIQTAVTAGGGGTVAFDPTGQYLVITSGTASATSRVVIGGTAVAALGLALGSYYLANDGDRTAGTNVGEKDDVQSTVENILGGSGDDYLIGSNVSNTISGNNGNDVIYGGPANADCTLDVDTLNGNNGNDWFYMGTASSCADTLVGGAGTNSVDYSRRTVAVTIKLDNTATSGEALELDKIATDINVAYGGSQGDAITGSNSADTLYGGGGADTIKGGAGNDLLYGGAGDDELDGEAGDDYISELEADTQWPYFQASFAAVAGSGLGNDVVNGGNGTDTVDFNDRTHATTLSLCVDAASIGAGACTANDAVATVDTTNNLVNLEIVIGATGAYANTIQGAATGETFIGGAGVDTFNGGDGNDYMYGHASNVAASTEVDLLTGEEGDDFLEAGANALLNGECGVYGSAALCSTNPGTGNICVGGSTPKFCL